MKVNCTKQILTSFLLDSVGFLKWLKISLYSMWFSISNLKKEMIGKLELMLGISSIQVVNILIATLTF